MHNCYMYVGIYSYILYYIIYITWTKLRDLLDIYLHTYICIYIYIQ